MFRILILTFVVSTLTFLLPGIYAQNSMDTIKVYFLYGSKPCPENNQSEKHLFGGIHGGHVSIGIDSFVVGFHHLQGIRLFPHRKNYDGAYESIALTDFNRDTVGKQYATIVIPITKTQYLNLKNLYRNYLEHTPYDYAFFGMRCTAAAYDVLSKIELFTPKTHTRAIISNFYPRLLRKRLFKLAKQNQYNISIKRGNPTRIWEKD